MVALNTTATDGAPLPRGKRVLFAALVLALVAVAQELVFRQLFHLPEILNFNRVVYSSTQSTPHAARHGQFLCGRRFAWRSDPDGAGSIHDLNLYGFRDGEWSLQRPPDTQARVLFVGDSFVESFMAAEPETIPRQFQRALAARGVRLDVMNGGIGGSSPTNYLALIRDAVPIFRPDWLVLVFFANDFPVGALDPAWENGALQPERPCPWMPRAIQLIADVRTGKAAVPPWPGAPFPFLRPVPDPGNPFSDPAFAAYWDSRVRPDIRAAMKAGRFNGWMVNNYAIMRHDLVRPFDITPYLQAVRAYLERHGTQLLVAYIPDKTQVADAYLDYARAFCEPQKFTSLTGAVYQAQAHTLAAACAEQRIPFVDSTPALREAESQGQRLYFDYDSHLRAPGYRLVAEQIAAAFASAAAELRP